MAKLEIDEATCLQMKPADVYDVASLMVAELNHLHSRLPSGKPPRQVFAPGRKFPSHVYQRVGLLEVQLEQLEKLVRKSPGWLKTE